MNRSFAIVSKTRLNRLAMRVLATMAVFAAGRAEAGFLVSASGVSAYEYGGSAWSNMTSYLDAATGNDITVAADLSNFAQVFAADGLWIDVRTHGIGTFTIAEKQNLASFIATGKRVVILGEHSSWTSWNSSLLSVVGGTFDSSSQHHAITTTVLSHELTTGVSNVKPLAAGIANGGTPLFGVNIATLWGAQQNVLTLLDSNMFSNSLMSQADNQRFAQNTADWFGDSKVTVSPVPEPASLALLGIGGIGMLGGAIRKRHKTAAVA